MALYDASPLGGWFGSTAATNAAYWTDISTTTTFPPGVQPVYSAPRPPAAPLPSKPQKVDPFDWLRERVGEVVALGQAA